MSLSTVTSRRATVLSEEGGTMAVTDVGAIGGSIASGLTNSLFNNGLANAISGSSSNSSGYTDSWREGGSQNSAYSVSGSENNAESNSWGNVAGLEASANSAIEAERAHERQKELLQMAQEYNSREAEKQRNWQADMANTVYTRSVKNMIEAGINPILAANLGLSAGNVSSGASASVGTPSSFMGQTFAEQNTASHSASTGSSFSNSSQKGSSFTSGGSHSEDWSNSRSGLAEGLLQMADISEAAYNAITSSEALKWTMENFGDGRNLIGNMFEKAKDAIAEGVENFQEGFKPNYNNYGDHGFGNLVH